MICKELRDIFLKLRNFILSVKVTPGLDIN